MTCAGKRPELQRVQRDQIAYWTDPRLADDGILIAFSERTGGVSETPYASLNLAGHVGDVPEAVDENRTRFMEALGIGALRSRLVCAEQVHGDHMHWASGTDAGRGSYVSVGTAPVPATDSLLTCEPDLPLMLLFADCVPVVLAVPHVAVAVVHAGWRGALASLPGTTAAELARRTGCGPSDVRAFVGPHIGACHYVVGTDVMSHFVDAFGTVARAESGGLDLAATVTASLTRSGVDPCNIARLGKCTAETTDRFFSYRAEGAATGRHAALVCMLS